MTYYARKWVDSSMKWLGWHSFFFLLYLSKQVSAEITTLETESAQPWHANQNLAPWRINWINTELKPSRRCSFSCTVAMFLPPQFFSTSSSEILLVSSIIRWFLWVSSVVVVVVRLWEIHCLVADDRPDRESVHSDKHTHTYGFQRINSCCYWPKQVLA